MTWSTALPSGQLDAEYLEARGLVADAPLVPTLMTAYSTAAPRASEGDQKGHVFAARALPQVVPPGGCPEEHFQAAACYAREGHFPLDERLAAEQDLQCVAAWTAAKMHSLSEHRCAAHTAV